MKISFLISVVCLGILSVQSDCKKPLVANNTPPPPPSAGPSFSYWVTNGDQSALLQKQTSQFSSGAINNSYPVITVDSTQTFQTVEGFGYTLTGGSAYLIHHLPASDQSSLLQELFGTGENSIGVSYLRISIGASDLSQEVFSYDDLTAGQTDSSLAQFSLSKDTVDLVPVLQQILAVNPSIKILGSPWSPPVWMKDNGSSKGGSLLPQYYDLYAKYFVKYVQAMKARGITITAITPQNEPLNPDNNPSMYMTGAQERDFIKNNLGPAFQAAGVSTKIIVFDHNCDHPDYPLTILNDASARSFVDGSAFHLYAGDISALSPVHDAYPDKNLYFTEQWTASTGDFGGDLKWHLQNVIIGSMRNWSKIALEWNLANDASYNPHTPGGCTQCKGAITINGTISRNVSYYIIAHAAKFVPPGSRRIASNIAGDFYNVAFLTPAGKKVLIVVNTGNSAGNFNVKFNGYVATPGLPGGAAATFVW